MSFLFGKIFMPITQPVNKNFLEARYNNNNNSVVASSNSEKIKVFFQNIESFLPDGANNELKF